MRSLILIVLVLSMATLTIAQDDGDDITNAVIAYGETVNDTITALSIYDQWVFRGTAGDAIKVTMIASDGLAPLIGLVDVNGDLIARSDAQPDGTFIEAEVNSTAVLEFVLPADSEYTVVATRVGNFDGTTTGSYTLTIGLQDNDPLKDLQDVVFRCDVYEITTAATVEFEIDPEYEGDYSITVYGLDGFLPYIRIDLPVNQGFSDCSSDGTEVVGDQFTLADGTTVSVIEGSPINARHNLQGMSNMGTATLIIGSRDGTPGRYVAVLEGFNINPGNDADNFNFRLGPLATESEMLVYMFRASNARIDPQIRMVAQNPQIEFTCDDAGRRDCAELPSATDYRFIMNDGLTIDGDRLDSGVKIATGNPDRVRLVFRSRTQTTTGDYTIVMMGELP